MVIRVGEIAGNWTKRMLNIRMRHDKVQEEWRRVLIIPIRKKKGDVQEMPRHHTVVSKSCHVENIRDG